MHNTRNKILGRHEAHRLAGRREVVFTNGCFDILHPDTWTTCNGPETWAPASWSG